MEVSIKLVRVFLGIVTGFLEHVRAGGGGSVTIPGNTCPSGPLCICMGHRSGVIRCWGRSLDQTFARRKDAPSGLSSN